MTKQKTKNSSFPTTRTDRYSHCKCFVSCACVSCEQGSQQSGSSGGGGGVGNSGAIPAIEITKENADHRNDMAYASDDSDYQESTSDRRASNAAPVNNPGTVDTDQGVGSSYHPHPIHHQQQQQPPPQQHHQHHHSARGGAGASSSAVHIRTDHGQVQHSPGSSSSAHHPQQQQVSDTMMRCH